MGRIKKIVWFAPTINISGGGERTVLEGLKHFENSGIEAYLVTFQFNRKAVFEGTYKPRIILTSESNETTANPLLRLTRLLSNIFLLRKKLRDINPDIIITQGQWHDCIPIYLATLFTHLYYVVHIWGSIFTFADEYSKYTLILRRHFNKIRESVPGYIEFIPIKPPRLGFLKWLKIEIGSLLRYLANRKAKKIFVLSKQNKWEVKQLYGKDALVLKGAYPSRIFDYKPREDMKAKLNLVGRKMILSVSRLVPKKRVDLCIEAFSKIAKRLSDVVLIIGGNGPEKNRLKEMVKSLGIESEVRFVGYIKDEELWDYYACCDLFVHLDLADFDLAPYDALALGKKVIWSTEMEVDSILCNNRFIFATEPNVDDVAIAIEKALKTNLGIMTPVEKSNLSYYTWDKHFSRLLREMDLIPINKR